MHIPTRGEGVNAAAPETPIYGVSVSGTALASPVGLASFLFANVLGRRISNLRPIPFSNFFYVRFPCLYCQVHPTLF